MEIWPTTNKIVRLTANDEELIQHVRADDARLQRHTGIADLQLASSSGSAHSETGSALPLAWPSATRRSQMRVPSVVMGREMAILLCTVFGAPAV